MPNQPLGRVLGHVRELIAARHGDGSSDRELLARFLARRDEAAFAALVRRHAPMVLGVCRRVLRHAQDAEDACQATFLVLARKAGSIHKGDAVGSWLYGVAYRVSLRMRARVLRQHALAEEATPITRPDFRAEVSWKEFLAVLDEELNRLPAGYRGPLVLCHLEGQTQDQAARQLGWTMGKLRGQLERGREMLRSRLTRRGMCLSGALLAASLSPGTAGAAALVPEAVATAAAHFAAGALTCQVPLRAATVAREVLRGMAMSRIPLVASVLLAVTVMVTGAGLMAQPVPKASEPAPDPAAGANDLPRSNEKPARPDRGDPIPVQALARFGSDRLRHGGPIHAVAFAKDGYSLASVGTDHTIRIWDPVTGKLLAAFADPGTLADPYSPTRFLYCVACSPDGKTVAAGEHEAGWQDGAISLWDTTTRKRRLTLKGHQGGTRAVVFSSDGKTLISGGTDGAIRVWNTVTGKDTASLIDNTCRGVTAIGFAEAGKTIVAAALDGTVRIWDVKTEKQRWRIEAQLGAVSSMAVSPDGKMLASVGADKSVGLYEVNGGKEIRRLAKLPAGPQTVAFSGNGKVLAVATTDRLVHLFDPVTGKKLRSLRGAIDIIHSVTFGKDDKVLAGAGGNDVIRRWDVATGKEVPPPGGNQGPIGSLQFTQDGKVLVSGGYDWTTRLWDVDNGNELFKHLTPQVQGRTVALSHDGTLLALARTGGGIAIVEARTGKERRQLAGHKGELVQMAFGPGDKTLASAGMDHKVRIWDMATGRAAHTLDHDGPVMHVVLSADGKLLATTTKPAQAAGAANALRRALPSVSVWNAVTGQEMQRLGHNQPVESIAFSPDSRTLAAGTQDGTVSIWDAVEWRRLRQLGPHAGWVMGLAFAPDGRTLAVGGWRSVRIWELATGTERVKIQAHWGDVCSLAFRPDGRAVATASNDTTILLWDLTGRGRGGKAAKRTHAELRRLWEALGDKDAAEAGPALWGLVGQPKEAVAIFKEHLAAKKPPVDAKRLAALIANLDHDEFTERERAENELRKLGAAAEAALRKAQAGDPSPEVRGRIVKLLGLLAPGALSPERLRPLRAVEALERIGTPEARQVLDAIGKGAEGSELTREAQASLARLMKRPLAQAAPASGTFKPN